MNKLVILVLSIAFILAASASAQMQCSVVPPNMCPATSVKVIGMTSLSAGGSHASIPTDQTNALVSCCNGIDGLSVTYAHEGADIYLTSAREAHVGRVEGENGIKLTAPTTLSCGYFNDCISYDTCVFSISGDRDAHISDCGNYAFSKKLCCRAGEMVGEQLPVEPEEETAAHTETTAPATEETNTAAPASPEERMNIPPNVKTKRISLPSHVKLFLQKFLQGRMTGSFFKIWQ